MRSVIAMIAVSLAAGCLGPPGDDEDSGTAATDGFEEYGPGAEGGMTLSVRIYNDHDTDEEVVVELYTPDDILIWRVEDSVPAREGSAYSSKTTFSVENHPDVESYEYGVVFSAAGKSVRETYGVSQFHSKTIAPTIDGTKIYVSQSYY